MQLQYTYWPSLYDINKHLVITARDWAEFGDRFVPLPQASKNKAPGFGPYALTPPTTVCKHGAVRAHRCDACVSHLTLIVFDADIGTEKEVSRCDSILSSAGVARLWYSTYSHGPDRAAYRLVIPLARPVPGDHWNAFRAAARRMFEVPADPGACSGRSHFYFLPSHRPDATPIFHHHPGQYLDPSEVPVLETPRPAPRAVVVDWEPPTEPMDLTEARGRLQALVDTWSGNTNRGNTRKAELLRRCLEGQALAQHLERNTSTLVVSGILAHALPEASLDSLRQLIQPSLLQMIAEGSKLTHAQVDRMLLTAMRHAAGERALSEQAKKRLEALREGLMERDTRNP